MDSNTKGHTNTGYLGGMDLLFHAGLSVAQLDQRRSKWVHARDTEENAVRAGLPRLDRQVTGVGPNPPEEVH